MRALQVFAISVLISMQLSIFLVAFWLLYPYKLIEFNQPYATVTNKVISTGDFLEYTLDYCKYTKLDAEIHRSFIDGVIYLTTDGIADVKEGCGKQKIRMYVPRAMAEGKYRLLITREYHVNPIRTVTIRYLTEEFEVL